MKSAVVLYGVIVCSLLSVGRCQGQFGGNAVYGRSNDGDRSRTRAEQRQSAMRAFDQHDVPPTATSTFVDASVLLNVKADEYVAVFAVAREGATPAECSTKMEATINEFTAALSALGVRGNDLYVDFIAQSRVYGFELKEDVLQERLDGFELKKNVSIHFTSPAMLERLTLAAARSQIFDLVKVDYVVKDIASVQDKLMEQAAALIKKKVARSDRLLDIKLQPPAQVYAERYAVYYPTQMYDSYTAKETEDDPNRGDTRNHTIRHLRKSRTFYLNSLDGDGFDAVINPVITEPVVQCTLYLKLKYEVDQLRAK